MKKFLILIAILLPVVCAGGFAAGTVAGLAWREARLAQAEYVPAYASAPISTPAYLAQMQRVMERNTFQMQRLQALMASPAFDAQTWQREVERALVALDANVAEVRAIAPPAEMAGVHVHALRLASETAHFTANVRAGVRAKDFAAMMGVIDNVAEMGRIIDDLDAAMRQ